MMRVFLFFKKLMNYNIQKLRMVKMMFIKIEVGALILRVVLGIAFLNLWPSKVSRWD